jgi:hypothetical protein
MGDGFPQFLGRRAVVYEEVAHGYLPLTGNDEAPAGLNLVGAE